jgi:hypothetical protein
VEKEGEQCFVQPQGAGVIDESHLAKPVHKVADSRPRGTDYLSQRSLAHFQVGGIWLGLRPQAREQQKSSRQPLLAGIALRSKILTIGLESCLQVAFLESTLSAQKTPKG